MQSLETQRAERAWRLVHNERGPDPAVAEVDLLREDQVFQGEEAPHPVNAGCGSCGRGRRWGELGVWTVSTPWVPDWFVLVPDWAGFRMFWREASVCKGWHPV
jgi:hypothetical protein